MQLFVNQQIEMRIVPKSVPYGILWGFLGASAEQLVKRIVSFICWQQQLCLACSSNPFLQLNLLCFKELKNQSTAQKR